MKGTCVVRVDSKRIARFYDGGGSTADVGSWPGVLKREFPQAGVYSIRRVKKSIPRAVHVSITGTGQTGSYSVPAMFDEGYYYGICDRLLRELGVKPPPEDKQKTLHLVVTKRRK